MQHRRKSTAYCSKRKAREFEQIAKRVADEFHGTSTEPRTSKGEFRPVNKLKIKRGLLLVQHGPKCAYCGRNLTPATVTRDHVIPLAQGGKDSGNIVPACLRCNRLKGPLTKEQFREAARTAWENRRELADRQWSHLFSRFGQVGVSFYCDSNEQRRTTT